MVSVDPDGGRLKALRELHGLTQIELSKQVGIRQSVISDIEKGRRRLTPDSAVSISQRLRVPLSFFEQPNRRIEDAAVSFRKTAGASASSTTAAVRRLLEAERLCSTLLDRFDQRPAGLPLAHSDFPLSGEELEVLAAQTREALGVPHSEPVRHVMRALERSGIAVVPLSSGDDAVAHAMDGHSGITEGVRPNGTAVVGYVPTTAGDRQRLTIAHELGHIVLHSARTVPVVKEREAEAMRFAGAFLYPAEVATKDLSETVSLNGYVRLKAQWGTSIQALIRRGHDLALISPARYKSLSIQVSSRGWRKEEPVEVGQEQPALMWALLTRGYGHTPYARASHELGVEPEFLKTWIPERQSPAKKSHAPAEPPARGGDVVDFRSPRQRR
ncbi:XRE family transcriptional regulator [Rhodococcus sp. 14-2470-1a]|uniref:XRE family transcriptional regulator n=1 Tax=Rhodococcus sp. 14-2470-1a TaxID=2023150 RepID=UPI0015C63789|nr:XRE family transcriptional regulator [Rhodococcus sp. 14-2470-1a]